MNEANYSEWHNGWLAFKYGKVLRTKDGAIKVFATEALALKAAAKSKMAFGTWKIGR